MTEIMAITNPSILEDLFAKSHQQPVLIFKHSTTCSISAAAHREFKDFVAKLSDDQALICGIILVREDKPVSNFMAEASQVQHQSPQAILISKGRAVWNASHWDITTRGLADAVKACE